MTRNAHRSDVRRNPDFGSSDLRPARLAARPVGLVGAPTDVGAGTRGADLGPAALRAAGLPTALGAAGRRVVDRGDVAGPVNPEQAPRDGHRHLPETVAWCRAVRDAIADSLEAEEVPILLGGDHALSIGSVAAVARHCERRRQPLCVLWLDAHPDFNTAATSPTGNIHGMSVAVLCGDGDPDLLALGHAVPMVEPRRVFQLGARSVDRLERDRLAGQALALHDMEEIRARGMEAVLSEVLAIVTTLGAHLHVSLDLDFLDPGVAPGVGTPVAGGASRREAQLCMDLINAGGHLGSLDVVELNPTLDVDHRTAGLAVSLVERIFAERALERAVS